MSEYKKLKLRIIKLNKSVVVERLEIEGPFISTDHIKYNATMTAKCGLYLGKLSISLNADFYDRSWDDIHFQNDNDRDTYVKKLIAWISNEQFRDRIDVAVGDKCLISNDRDNWVEGEFAGSCTDSPITCVSLYYTRDPEDKSKLLTWKYVKALDSVKPCINGDIYTWEINRSKKRPLQYF